MRMRSPTTAKMAALTFVILLGVQTALAAETPPPAVGNPTLAAPASSPPGAGPAKRRWLHRNYRPAQIYGCQLMTQQEIAEYQAQINAAQTADERLQIRQEHRTLMLERAKERGITLPPPPKP